jgi:hypothetical protein
MIILTNKTACCIFILYKANKNSGGFTMKKVLLTAFFAFMVSSCGGGGGGLSSSGNSLCSSTPSSNTPAGTEVSSPSPRLTNLTSFIVPLYTYPFAYNQTTGQREDESNWKKLYNDINPSKSTYVIANPNTGPGDSPNSDYSYAMGRLKEKGYKVLGYVSSAKDDGQGWYTIDRDLAEVEKDIDNWIKFYGDKIDGFFIDHYTGNHDRYVTIYNYIKEKYPDKVVILGAGQNIEDKDKDLFDKFDKITVVENKASYFLGEYSYKDYYSSINSDKVCSIIYDVDSNDKVSSVKDKMLQNNSSCGYITHQKANSYTELSNYLGDLMNNKI